ncbi:hypothetical protein NDU88_003028 [Pleurodeles waltl]|uniref:Uncharacterized protein n=1 Tax=Pleurodeles waltl TaxID=8319 RepID=A0AAV7TNJ5_PLEWA|nr:hypothetical protein NDU88_003028 [Pleurodeles waltl]
MADEGQRPYPAKWSDLGPTRGQQALALQSLRSILVTGGSKYKRDEQEGAALPYSELLRQGQEPDSGEPAGGSPPPRWGWFLQWGILKGRVHLPVYNGAVT